MNRLPNPPVLVPTHQPGLPAMASPHTPDPNADPGADARFLSPPLPYHHSGLVAAPPPPELIDDCLLSELMDLDSLVAVPSLSDSLIPVAADNAAIPAASSYFLPSSSPFVFPSSSSSSSFSSSSSSSSSSSPLPLPSPLDPITEPWSLLHRPLAAAITAASGSGGVSNEAHSSSSFNHYNLNHNYYQYHRRPPLLPPSSLPVWECKAEEDCGAQRRAKMGDVAAGFPTVTERIRQALIRYAEASEGDFLAQVWAPVGRGSRVVLATDLQPFVLGRRTDCIVHFRQASAAYTFSLALEDGESKEGEGEGEEYGPGLPGRVFLSRAPEWTPNVQLYSKHEYLRKNEAVHCNVRGTIGLPVFAAAAGSCVAVIELAVLSDRIVYRDDMHSLCRALQAVNLSSSETDSGLLMQVQTDMRQVVLAEISEVLKAVSETHRLPLALTWLPHYCVGGEGSNRACLCCKGAPFYAGEECVAGFRRACTEHYLWKGQGVVGRAYAGNQPAFSSDIKAYRKREYPLCHYARVFGLTAAVAVRLRSMLTRADDYVLEFFLPRACADSVAQQALLNALSITMQRVCRTLRTVTKNELDEEMGLEGTEPARVITPSPPPASSTHEPYPPMDSAIPSEPVPTPPILPGSGRKYDRRRGAVEKTIGLSILQQYFAGSLKDAAKSIGVCPTTLKRICRQHGISRWPSRKIKKVSRTLKKLQVVIDSVQGCDGALRINALANDNLASTAKLVQMGGIDISNNNNNKPNDSTQKPLTGGSQKTEEVASELFQDIRNEVATCASELACDDDREGSDSSKKLNNTRIYGETPTSTTGKLHCKDTKLAEVEEEEWDESEEEEEEVSWEELIHPPSSSLPLFIGSSSSSMRENELRSPSTSSDKSKQSEEEGGWVTVKAKYGDDIARFKFHASAGYQELREEVARRFKVQRDSFELKYLDDEEEWVMLTCNEDLCECFDILKSSAPNHIKLLVRNSTL